MAEAADHCQVDGRAHRPSAPGNTTRRAGSLSWWGRNGCQVGDRPVEADEHPLQFLGLLGGLAGQGRRGQPGAGHQRGQLLHFERGPDHPGPVPAQLHLRPQSP